MLDVAIQLNELQKVSHDRCSEWQALDDGPLRYAWPPVHDVLDARCRIREQCLVHLTCWVQQWVHTTVSPPVIIVVIIIDSTGSHRFLILMRHSTRRRRW